MERTTMVLATMLLTAHLLNAFSSDMYHFQIDNDLEQSVAVSVVYDSSLQFFDTISVVSVSRGGVELSVGIHRLFDGTIMLRPETTLSVLRFRTELYANTFSRSFLPAVFSRIELSIGDDRYTISENMFDRLRVCVNPLSPTTANYVVLVSDLISLSDQPDD